VGQAFGFDGNDDYVSFQNSTSIDYTDFTYDAWIAPDPSSPDADNYIICKGATGVYRPLIFIAGYAHAHSWAVYLDGTRLDGGPVTYDYQHVALTRSGTTARLYVDGVLKDTQTVGTTSAAGYELTVGRISDYSTAFFKGRLDEFELFNRALSDCEIFSLYKAGSAGKCKNNASGPVADLEVSKTASPSPATATSNLTYTVTVHNNGPDTATGVLMSDTLPAAVSYGSAVASQGGCSESGGIVTCDLGNLRSNVSATVTIVVTPTTPGYITNTVEVAASESDPDCANNFAAAVSLVVAPPCAITCPGNITTNNTAGQCGALVTYSPPTDNGFCGVVGCDHPSGSFFPVGTTTVHCNTLPVVGDDDDDTINSPDLVVISGGCSFTVTIVDIQPPTISASPANTNVPCSSAVPPADDSSVTATDNCCGPTVSHDPDVITTGSCSDRYSIARTYHAADCHGNTNSVTQTITVNDTTAPVLVCPDDMQLQCGDPTGTNSTGVATATDTCGGTVTITFSNASSANCTGAGIDRTWTATDGCGNSTSCVQHITFVDTTVPTIVCPDDRQLQCGASTATNATGVATAMDNCNGPLTITFTNISTAANCTGRAGIDRVWTATDHCSNSASCVQHITFVDTNAPTFNCPGNITSNATGPSGATVTYTTPTATDNCGGSPPVTCSPASGTLFPTGMTTVTCTATDACSNQASCHFTVTVNSISTKPTVTIRTIEDSVSESGREDGLIRIFRTGSTSSRLIVNYTVSGTATPGVDYVRLSGQVTIAIGKSSANIKIQGIQDHKKNEGTESVILTLSPNSNYNVGSPSQAMVHIRDGN
jgi:uncharacterized repeat protein (TIGR01451 family)